MNRRLLLSFTFALGLLSPPLVIARGGGKHPHPGQEVHSHDGQSHSHGPISESQAKERAVSAVATLVSQGKVEEDWKTRQPSVQQKKFEKQTEWVATFENLKSRDLTKRRLYVFLSLSGEFLAANHTGK